MYVLGIKCSGHDTGAALLTDRTGTVEISAISEARLNRRKHSYAYPLLSIRYVMDRFGLKSLNEIDLICIDKHGELWPEKDSQFGRLAAKTNNSQKYDLDVRFNYLIEQSILFPKDKVVYVNHIDAHAASTYFVSGFKESAILTIEGGIGNYVGEGREIRIIDRSGYGGDEYQDGKMTFDSTTAWPPHRQNISNLYDLITKRLGLDEFAAGKTMALAAFYDRFPVKNHLNIPKDRHQGFMTDYTDLIGRLASEVRSFKPTSKATKDVELLDEYWVNIAREAQEALEEDVLFFASLASKKSGSKNLCLAGGVALSCVTNRKILDLGLFDNVFVQPAASDEGIPLGGALWGYYQILKGNASAKMDHAYLGTPNDSKIVSDILEKYKFSYRKTTSKEVAGVLANGNIIGRIAGGSEYGPRALGNRSILADPRIANMLEVVNTQIKHRERFRPFAPSCHADKQDRYFDIPCPSPFMLMACSVFPDAKDKIPAVMHVDGSSRVQSVTPAQNAKYYDLIEEFGKLSGVYTLLNTSFNDDGEPIVENYEDALLSFVRTGLHHLYIEDYLVDRPSPEICNQLRQELASTVKARVEKEYQAAIESFCDVGRYRKIESSLKSFQLGEILLRISAYVRRAKKLKFNPQSSKGIAKLFKTSVNAIGNTSRHGRWKIASFPATWIMLWIDLNYRILLSLKSSK
ncbi:carbamoyltransferase [Leptospira kmetyi]|uniref:Carbamoyltransferase n=1 Tax=Leptospira kmetyi TaxID=408139 RepID=A0AAD0UTJ7_9LEPT|nr:carbamoyltransferase C-terminal domain-containing protein [Leptospira kmetyi]AYV57209.1 carbamoyltransferase [Leptospira kmetyi]TGL68278.1 carbamoyltransferase [Leptospira kmetyi]